jgi:hypothetical protein
MCLQVCHICICTYVFLQGAIYYWHQTDDANSILEAARNVNVMNTSDNFDDDSDDVAATERALHVPALIVLAMFIIVTYVVWFCVCCVAYFVYTFAFVIVVGTLSYEDCI